MALTSFKRPRFRNGTPTATSRVAVRGKSQKSRGFQNEIVTLLQRTQFPAVLLEMAGCHDLFVNDAHGREFGRTEFNVLPCDAPTPVPVVSTHAHDDRCYCEKVGSLFALSSNFCAFERAFRRLQSGADEYTVTAFLNGTTSSRSRRYTVHRVTCRLAPATSSQKPEMIALVVSIPQMAVTVKTIAARAGSAHLGCSVKWRNEEILHIREKVIRHPTYAAFDKLLQKAEQQLRSGEKIATVKDSILARLYEVVDQMDYEPIKGFVQWLFRRFTDPKNLTRELLRTRHRLFDAVLVTADVEPKIHQKIDQAFANACTEMQSTVEWPLVRGRLDFSQLQAIGSLQTCRRDLLPAGAGRTKEAPPAQQGGIWMQTDHPKWEARLASYAEKKAIKFPSREERNKALDALWEDKDLSGMPRDYVDGLTLVVPAKAVPFFSRKGLAFEEFDVFTPG